MPTLTDNAAIEAPARPGFARALRGARDFADACRIAQRFLRHTARLLEAECAEVGVPAEGAAFWDACADEAAQVSRIWERLLACDPTTARADMICYLRRYRLDDYADALEEGTPEAFAALGY
jgi:hypothetical protein